MGASRAHVRLVELDAQLSEIYAQQSDHCFLLPALSLITVNARTFAVVRRPDFIQIPTWSQPFAANSGSKLTSELILLTWSLTSYYTCSAGCHLRPRQPRRNIAVASSSSNNTTSRGDQLDRNPPSRLTDRHIHYIITITTRANMNITRELYGCRNHKQKPRMGTKPVLNSFPAQLKLSIK